jgi:hypothetical protein
MAETEKNRPDAVHDHKCTIATTNAKNPAMDDGLFDRELGYQAGLSIAEGLLLRGLLTEGDFQRTKALLLAKYRPPIGELLAEAG